MGRAAPRTRPRDVLTSLLLAFTLGPTSAGNAETAHEMQADPPPQGWLGDPVEIAPENRDEPGFRIEDLDPRRPARADRIVQLVDSIEVLSRADATACDGRERSHRCAIAGGESRAPRGSPRSTPGFDSSIFGRRRDRVGGATNSPAGGSGRPARPNWIRLQPARLDREAHRDEDLADCRDLPGITRGSETLAHRSWWLPPSVLSIASSSWILAVSEK